MTMRSSILLRSKFLVFSWVLLKTSVVTKSMKKQVMVLGYLIRFNTNFINFSFSSPSKDITMSWIKFVVLWATCDCWSRWAGTPRAMRSRARKSARFHRFRLNYGNNTLKLLLEGFVIVLEERDELVVFLLVELHAVILGQVGNVGLLLQLITVRNCFWRSELEVLRVSRQHDIFDLQVLIRDVECKLQWKSREEVREIVDKYDNDPDDSLVKDLARRMLIQPFFWQIFTSKAEQVTNQLEVDIPVLVFLQQGRHKVLVTH